MKQSNKIEIDVAEAEAEKICRRMRLFADTQLYIYIHIIKIELGFFFSKSYDQLMDLNADYIFGYKTHKTLL